MSRNIIKSTNPDHGAEHGRLQLAPSPRRKWGPFEYATAIAASAICIGVGSTLLGGHNYGVRSAVRRNVAPLEVEVGNLNDKKRGLEEKTSRLSGRVDSLETDLAATASARDSYSETARKTREELSRNKARADSAEAARRALIQSYPSEIRNKEYTFNQTTQNNMRVIQLGIEQKPTENPAELADRYSIWKRINDSYPGLEKEAKEKNPGKTLISLRGVERDNNVYDIRAGYEGSQVIAFTYKHLELINPNENKREIKEKDKK